MYSALLPPPSYIDNGVTALSADAREELSGGVAAASRDGAAGSSSGSIDGTSVAIGAAAGVVAVLLGACHTLGFYGIRYLMLAAC